MTRDEILGLSKMSGGEQRKLLASNRILKQTVQEFAGSEPRALVYHESLPDLAERLWREADRSRLLNGILAVYVANQFSIFPDFYPETDSDLKDMWEWFLLDATAINYIQAALLAKEGV